jgi:hypothetical protein
MESASKMTIIVFYCIVYYKYSSVIDEDHFLVDEVFNLLKTTFKFMKYVFSISKTRPFENDRLLVLVNYLN